MSSATCTRHWKLVQISVWLLLTPSRAEFVSHLTTEFHAYSSSCCQLACLAGVKGAESPPIHAGRRTSFSVSTLWVVQVCTPDRCRFGLSTYACSCRRAYSTHKGLQRTCECAAFRKCPWELELRLCVCHGAMLGEVRWIKIAWSEPFRVIIRLRRILRGFEWQTFELNIRTCLEHRSEAQRVSVSSSDKVSAEERSKPKLVIGEIEPHVFHCWARNWAAAALSSLQRQQHWTQQDRAFFFFSCGSKGA